MVTPQDVLTRIAALMGAWNQGITRRVRPRRRGDDPIQIVAYRGYGTEQQCLLLGRVLKDRRIDAASASDSAWKNLVSTYRRLESDEIPGARMRVSFAGDEQDVVTDAEGYFRVWLHPRAQLPPQRHWHDAALELVAPSPPGADTVRATGHVLVPPASAVYGVISDLDDTVVQTNVTSLVRMARTVFFGNARTRLPFKGVAAFYRALRDGALGGAHNPIFYVSSSPWNLYDLLTEFLELQGIPAGPLLLRDWGISRRAGLPNAHGPHKLGAIRQILETFPRLPFLLIGDSGQEDPEIYRDITRAFRGRILAAYIRNVTPHPERSAAIRALAREVVEAGSSLILADDTLAAAAHAAEHGWIAAAALAAIRAETQLDRRGAAGAAAPAAGGTSQADSAPTIIVEGTAAPEQGIT